MEKIELLAIIQAGNDTKETREKLETQIRDTHTEAGNLATQVLDHYQVKAVQPPPRKGSFFQRISPIMPIGEVDLSNMEGRTHGFVQITATLNRDVTFGPSNKHSFSADAKDGITVNGPGKEIIGLKIDLFSGTSEGTDLFKIKEEIKSHNGITYSDYRDVDQELVEQLQTREKMVGILEILVAEAGIDTPV